MSLQHMLKRQSLLFTRQHCISYSLYIDVLSFNSVCSRVNCHASGFI